MLAVANRLKVAKVLSIKQLHDQGWSQRRIARELGISRDAVARHLARPTDSGEPTTEEGDSNKATSEEALTGSQQQDGASNKATTRTKAPTGSGTPSPTDLTNRTADTLAESRSCCQPFRQQQSEFAD